jgi:hypothetical protein
MRKRKSDHIVANDKGAKCLHCGRYLEIPLPIEIPVFVAMSKSFIKAHKNCINERDCSTRNGLT